jgi:phosphoribosylanthranilate isomerase
MPYDKNMFRIKICGITNVADALATADAGADAIGLNFYRGSKRFIDADSALQIITASSGRTEPVGVFVNETVQAICQACREANLTTIQLHGEKRPDTIKLDIGLHDRGVSTPNLSIIRAHSFGPRGMAAVYEDMFDARGDAADAVLVDAAAPGVYGGTGQTIDWHRLVNYEESIGRVPLILAGGLKPENVAEAIRIVRPHAVDVASGVESSPGKKDHAKIRDFVAAAREAFAQLK